MTRTLSSIALVAGVVGALGLGGAALAADMGLPVKAPPPPAPPPLDIHGFVETDWESFLINPQGQALIDHGAVTTLAGLEWTLYKNKGGFINSFKVGGLVAADWSSNFPGYWGTFEPSANGDLFDTVMAITASVTFGQYWTLSEEFFNVYSGAVGCNPGTGLHCDFRPNTSNVTNGGDGANVGFGFLNFNQLSLTLNDSFTGWPISFNPYVRWYYEFQGDNSIEMPACFSCVVGSDFFIGATPTWNAKALGAPWLTFKVPVYVTVGGSGFWNGTTQTPTVIGGKSTGLTICCGVTSSGDLGVFTAGLTAVASLTWIPANYGAWYLKGGFQYYDVINAALVQSNVISICNGGPCSNWQTKDIFVGFVGLGVGF
jgi:hypothetical protein